MKLNLVYIYFTGCLLFILVAGCIKHPLDSEPTGHPPVRQSAQVPVDGSLAGRRPSPLMVAIYRERRGAKEWG